jgi:hypothetical protein
LQRELFCLRIAATIAPRPFHKAQRSHRRVDDELKRGIVIGLKARVLELEHALRGMSNRLAADADRAALLRQVSRRTPAFEGTGGRSRNKDGKNVPDAAIAFKTVACLNITLAIRELVAQFSWWQMR